RRAGRPLPSGGGGGRRPRCGAWGGGGPPGRPAGGGPHGPPTPPIICRPPPCLPQFNGGCDDGRRVRIAIVTETWLPSINGVVTRLAATVRELLARDHVVMVVCPTVAEPPGGVPDPPGAAVRHVPSVGLPFIYGGQPWGLPLPRVVRLLDGFSPDLIHAVSPFLLGWAGVMHARSRGLPLVCSYHTHIARYAHFYGMGFAEPPVWAVVRKAHQQAHVNLAASEASRAELEAQGVARVDVWRGGVDLDLFHPCHASAAMRERLTDGHPERRLCLYVGRLAAEKRIEV